MQCPKCERELREGSVKISSSVVGSLLIGLSWKNLYFTDKETKQKRKVLGSESRSRALRCENCGTIAIVGYDDLNDEDRLYEIAQGMTLKLRSGRQTQRKWFSSPKLSPSGPKEGNF